MMRKPPCAMLITKRRLTEGMGKNRPFAPGEFQLAAICRPVQSRPLLYAADIASFKARDALNAKIPFQDLRSRSDLAGWPFVGDMAIIDDVGAMRQGQCGSEILLYQNDRLPGVGEIASRRAAIIAIDDVRRAAAKPLLRYRAGI